ncbi:MAG: hypothetical protein GY910_20285 [bacterium]|nr:hypothetical protein [Deltaproteobacteria bacterium]MCP4907323.1 hypothetical protein [bacterium]
MSAEVLIWQDEHLLDHRRRLRAAMFVSLALHGVMFAAFAASPPSPVPEAPQYLAVDLVVASPAAVPVARSASRPAPSPPASAAEPTPPPPPSPPVAKAPVQVLPEETPGRIRKASPEPLAKVKKRPVAKPPPEAPARRRRPKEKALSFEDAMAALEDELGADETASLLTPHPSQEEVDPQDPSAAEARPGVIARPEQVAWDREVSRRIRARVPNFSRYRGRGLAVQIEFVVSAGGELVGVPSLLETSGDLDFDGLAIAGVERAAPLPPPPSPGPRRLRLSSEER